MTVEENSRILIVDDDSEFREMLREVLASEGFETLEAPDGNIAIDLAIKELPDLIITDLEMPVCDGFIFIEMLNECVDTQNIPVVVMSGKNYFDTLSSLRNAKYEKLIIKPIDIVSFVVDIKSLLSD